MKLKQVQIGAEKYPVHFGMAALIQVSEELGAEPDNLFSALDIKKHRDRLRLAHIGFNEGARAAGRDQWAFEYFTDRLDERPEALDEIIGLYYLDTFGPRFAEFIGKVEAIDDEGVQAAVNNLKNVWPVLTEKASQLASAEYTK